MFGHLNKLKNKTVEVSAHGITYRGILKEITDEAITLRTKTGWVSVPIDAVRGIQEEGAKSLSKQNKYINSSFFSAR